MMEQWIRVGAIGVMTIIGMPAAASPCDPILLGQIDSAPFGTWSSAAPPVFDTQPGGMHAYAASSAPGQFLVIDLFGGTGAEITASVLLPFDRPTGIVSVSPATVVVCGYDTSSEAPGWIGQYDVSDPTNPVLVGQVETESTPRDLVVSGSIVAATVRTEPPLDEFEGVSFFSLAPTGPEAIESINVLDAGGRVELADPIGGADVLFTCHNDVVTSIDFSDPAAPFVLAAFDVGRGVSGFDVSGTTAYLGVADCNPDISNSCAVLSLDFGPMGDAAPGVVKTEVVTNGTSRVVCATPLNAEVVISDSSSIDTLGAYVVDLTNTDLGPLITGGTGAPFVRSSVVLDGEGGRFVMAERDGVVRFFDVMPCEFPPPQFRIGGTLSLIGSSSVSVGGNQIPLNPQASLEVASGPDNRVYASGSTGSGGVRSFAEAGAELTTLTRGDSEGTTTVKIDAYAESYGNCYNSSYFSAVEALGEVDLVLSREYEVLDLFGSGNVSSSIGFSNIDRGIYTISFGVSANQAATTEDELEWCLEIQPAGAGPAPIITRGPTPSMPVRFDDSSRIGIDFYIQTFGDSNSYFDELDLDDDGLALMSECADTFDGGLACGSSEASIKQVGDTYVVRVDLGSDLSKSASCRYDLQFASTFFYGDSDEGGDSIVLVLDRVSRVIAQSTSSEDDPRDFELIDLNSGSRITDDILPAGEYGIRFTLGHEIETDDITQSTTAFMQDYFYELTLLPIETAGFGGGALGVTGQASGNGVSDSAFFSEHADSKSAAISGSTGSGGVRGDAATAAYIAEGDGTAALRILGTAFATASPGSNANIGVDNINYNLAGDPDDPLQFQAYRSVNYQITDQSVGGGVIMRDAGGAVVPNSGTLSPGLYSLAVSVNAFAFADDTDLFSDFQASQLDWALNMTVPRCAADMDGNGSINLDDIDMFVTAFLAGSTHADCDASGVLNFDDIDCFASSFLGGCL